MIENAFGGTGQWFNYRNKFNCPHIPSRMRNAIESELNAETIGHSCTLPIPDGVDCKKLIPNWLIVLWIEMDLIIRLPNIGPGTINETLQVIADCLKE